MNKVFTKKKEIILDEKYKLIPDSDSGVVLVFQEERQKETVVLKNKKKVKTGVFEPYMFTENLYYPRVAQALRHYAGVNLNCHSSIEEVANRSEEIYSIIEALDKEFKQF